jgi:hypothetical protein
MLTAMYSPGEKVPSRTVLTFIPIGLLRKAKFKREKRKEK